MRILFLILMLFVSPTLSWAEACYQPSEYQAEQIVRFQTQLMVIAMVCDPHTEQELYGDYQKFSNVNQDVIKGNEQELVHFFQRDNTKSSLKKLHTLRTDIANEMAQYASTQVPSKFCSKFKSRIDEAINLQPDGLTILINGMGTELPSSYPLCVDH